MNRNDYTIRAYTTRDEEQWVRCRAIAFLDSAYFDDVQREKPTYRHPAIELVAAHRNGAIVGFLDVECEEIAGTVCSQRPGLGGMVWNLGVHPDYRRCGIAVTLLNRAIALAKERGVVRLEAWTRDDEATLAWYRAQGFQAIDGYLHVYLQGEEAKTHLSASIPGLRPMHAFAHYQNVEDYEQLRSQFARVHHCHCFELKLQ